MKNVKKSIILFGAVAIALLMVSTVTAVPQVNSEPVMDYVEQIEQLQELLDDFGEDLDYINIDSFLLHLESTEVVNIIEEEVLALFMSTEFAELMHEDEIQNYLYSDNYLEFFNGEDVQNIVNSDEYATFLDSELCQTFLDNYFSCDETFFSPSGQISEPLNSEKGISVDEETSSMFFSTPVETMIGSTNGDQDPEPTFIIMLTLLAIIVIIVVVCFVLGAAAAVVLLAFFIGYMAFAGGILLVAGILLVIFEIIMLIVG